MQLFLEKGWTVGAYDLNTDALEEAFGGEEQSDQVVWGFLDVTDLNACKTALMHFSERTGGA